MTVHAGLLKQARFLARKEPEKPTQAGLRRAVSASYRALFHLPIGEATGPCSRAAPADLSATAWPARSSTPP